MLVKDWCGFLHIRYLVLSFLKGFAASGDYQQILAYKAVLAWLNDRTRLYRRSVEQHTITTGEPQYDDGIYQAHICYHVAPLLQLVFDGLEEWCLAR